MGNGAIRSVDSYVHIFFDPHATIRRIVDTDPTRDVLMLAALGPALGVLDAMWSSALGGQVTVGRFWPLEVVLSVLFAAGIGIVALYFNGAFLRWAGGLLGGVATSVQVRAALAWSQIPGILGAAISIVALLSGASGPIVAERGGLPHLTGSLVSIGLLNGVLAIWGFVISLQTLGEVHRFSAWRALGAILIEIGLSIAVLIAGGVVIYYLLKVEMGS
jgi:Yip1 domain